MSRKLTVLLVISCALMLAPGIVAFAQTGVGPDSGVLGSGIVSFGANVPSYAQFDINVTRVGTALGGSFRWTEISTVPTAGFVRPPVIVSKQITGLTVNIGNAANFAVVEAIGSYNSIAAAITLNCTDRPGGDMMEITVTNIVPPGSDMPTIIYYHRIGPVTKGNLTVFSKPIPAAFAKGAGTINASNTNIGQFNFSAVSGPAGVTGGIHYVDFNPMAMSPIIKPLVVIDVRKFDSLSVVGNTGVMKGMGLLNGTPASVTVKVADLLKPGSPLTILDNFAIEAVPILASSLIKPYSASGPVIRGDIVVGTLQASTTVK